MVNKMAAHRTIISKKAKSGDLRPKNRMDQRTFNTSWIAKKIKAFFTFCSLKLFSHRRQREIPISTNKVIQTGENSQFGGLKDGFSSEAYQVGMEGVVNREPRKPANWQIKILIISLIKLFLVIFSSCNFKVS